MRRHKQHGFSLVELMTVIVILVVLGAIAYPAISALIPGFRLRAAGQEVYRALQSARTEAIKLNRKVTVDFDSMKCGDGPIPPVSGVGYEIHYTDRQNAKKTLVRGVLPPLVAVCEDRGTTMPKAEGKDAVRASFRANGRPDGNSWNKNIYLFNTKKRGLTARLDQAGSIKIINSTEYKNNS